MRSISSNFQMSSFNGSYVLPQRLRLLANGRTGGPQIVAIHCKRSPANSHQRRAALSRIAVMDSESESDSVILKFWIREFVYRTPAQTSSRIPSTLFAAPPRTSSKRTALDNQDDWQMPGSVQNVFIRLQSIPLDSQSIRSRFIND